MKIAILVSITSKGQKIEGTNGILFCKNSLPSFLSSIEDSKENTFCFYIGYDKYDKFYDNENNILEFKKKIYDIAKNKITLSAVERFSNTSSSPTHVWNRLFEKAYNDNCDYFYQVGDDVIYKTKGWDSIFIKKLINNEKGSNLGVCGPLDIGYPKIITQTFVSRIHMEIFGTMFPWIFRNIYMDNWIHSVYEDVGTFFIKNQIIYNEFGKPRYVKNNKCKIFLEEEILRGKESIRLYLSSNLLLKDDIVKRKYFSLSFGIFVTIKTKTYLLFISRETIKNIREKIFKMLGKK